ncbi:MAG: TIGR02281 family clan AA aspartic protease [Pseudomonadota bacterium]
MPRLFWILIGLTGLLLVALIATSDTGTTMGMETEKFAYAGIGILWALFVGFGMFGGGVRLGDTVKQLALWALIIAVLMGGYVLRYDLQDLGSRLTGGLIPGSPISRVASNGEVEVMLIRSDNGHFEAVAGVNDASIRFLVDTGATAIVLAATDAEAAGIDVDNLDFTILTQTANGTGRSALAEIKRFYLGGIERRNLRVMVAQRGRLNTSLLGQQFLETLSSYERRGDRLTLRD